jgi:hypothetical protein
MKKISCENPDCNKEFLRYPKDILTHNYCSSSCSAKVNNRKFPKRVAEIRICNHCCCKFKKVSKVGKYCSPQCQNISARSYKPDELIYILNAKAHELNRTPAKRELQDIASAVVNTFGTWNAGVKVAGLEPNRSESQRMYKRTRTVAKDGHQCDSISEAIIDNWLTSHNIRHERNVSYPSTNHRADWGLGIKYFIEYFGLANDSPRYDREIVIK